jgi:hypothetical protein
VRVYSHESDQFKAAKRFENGAATYSADLLRYQLANWEAATQGMDAILYTALPSHRAGQYIPPADISFTYLHTFPHTEPLRQIHKMRAADGSGRMVFITAYAAYHAMITRAGFESVYIPMSIAPMARREPVPHEKRLIWFGNLYHSKKSVCDDLRRKCKRHGWRLDVISKGRLNDGEHLSREQALDLIASYPYGVGVGRCAMEMQAIGLRVLIAGDAVGGLIMDDLDHAQQIKTNHNGRIATFSRDIDLCLDALPDSLQVYPLLADHCNHAAVTLAAIGVNGYNPQ